MRCNGIALSLTLTFLIPVSSCLSVNGSKSSSSLQSSASVSLSYPQSNLNLVILGESIALAPTVVGGQATSYSVSPPLPSGISLNPITGLISGSVTTMITAPTTYTITALTSAGSAKAQLSIATVFANNMNGAFTTSTSAEVINAYSEVTTTNLVANTTTSFEVGNGAAFSVGQEVLIIQMQKTSDVMAREFATIQSIAGNTITLTNPVKNNYASGVFSSNVAWTGYRYDVSTPAAPVGSTANTVTQIVSVPHYSNVTIPGATGISSLQWDGKSGGVVVFRASGSVNVSGAITTMGTGFRGGSGTGTPTPVAAWQGETFTGIGGTNLAAHQGGGGGGGVPSNQSNGGGGGYGTAGQAGGLGGGSGNAGSSNPGSGGGTYGYADLSSLLLGSGGGGGTCNTGCIGAPWGGQNAAGGGIIYILAHSITVNPGGSISSNGPAAQVVDWTASGGGSGGSVYLIANSMTLGTGLVTASGGAAGGNTPGGAGGDGRIRLDYNSLSGTTTPAAYTQTPLP